MGHYILAGDGRLIVERRANPRFDITMDVRIGLPAAEAPVQGSVTNLSEAGLQVVFTGRVEERDLLDLECSSFRGTAEVKWCRTEGSRVRAGLQFTALDARSRAAIQDLIAGAKGRSADPVRARSA